MANKDILPIQLFLFAMLITIPVYAQWEEIPIDPQYTLKNFPLEERSWLGINEKILFLGDCGWLSTIVALLYTDNGGDDWRELEKFPNWITDFHFINNKEGWLTSGGELWHTRDGGENWAQLPIELDAEEVPWAPNGILGSLSKIHFFDSNHGVGVFQWRFDILTGDARVIVATTQDGGRHWRSRKWVEFGDIIISWEIVGNRIWIPMWPEIWFSPDRGESWKELITPMGLYAFNFLEPNDGWSVVVGMSPQLFHTKDNGESWQFISELPPIYGQKGELLFVSDREGWLLSFPLFDGRRYHAVLWQTQDGGIHWQPMEWPIDPKVRECHPIKCFGRPAGRLVLNQSRGDLWVVLYDFDYPLLRGGIMRSTSINPLARYLTTWGRVKCQKPVFSEKTGF